MAGAMVAILGVFYFIYYLFFGGSILEVFEN